MPPGAASGAPRDGRPLPGYVLISADEIAARVRELGQALGREHAGDNPLLVGVLKGAVVFMADLIRAIPIPVATDFIGLASYGGGTRSSGAVRLTADLSTSIEGRDVVVVEDIVDSGRTADYLLRNLATRGPKRLSICTLLDKAQRREVDVRLDYVGFAIPDRFVVGYGFDFGEIYRTLPDIRVLEGDPEA